MISNNMRDVRVTEREATPRDFIAPELSPVRLIDAELEKGLKGWTDLDAEIEIVTHDGLPKGLAERQLEELTMGTVSRKAPSKARVRHPRPSVRRWA